MSEPNGESSGRESQQRPEDHRAHIRHQACFPAEILLQTGETNIAMIRDLSVSGALLYTRARLEVGDQVKLSLYILDDQNPRVATGQIVRSEKRGTDYAGMWPYSLGIKFDESLKDCEQEIVMIADQQAISIRPDLPPSQRTPPSVR